MKQRLQEIAARYHADLFDDFLPFMDKYVVDPVYGGFLCETDGHGVHTSTEKFSWFEGRGIWVYSFLYNNLAHESKYIDVARGSVEFILGQRTKDSAETWPSRFTREGKPLTGPDPEIYGDLFIAEGLAEFSLATKDPHYWDMAKELVLKCIRIYDRDDYHPEIGRTYLGPAARPFPGARVQGAWMVLIRVATQMLRIRGDQELEAVAKRCVDAVMNHHFNPRFRLNNELLNHDLSRPTNEYEQLVYTGHCIEISWMLLEEALRTRDMELFHTVTERFQRHVEVARDRVYDGVLRNLMNVDENKWALDKVLWAQEEVTIAALMIFEHTGVPWAWDMFLHFAQYTHEKYSLKQFGIPLWIYGADRQVTTESYFKEPARVENYHQPRHLMINLLRMDSMLRSAASHPNSPGEAGGGTP
jgi:mannose/cellobiose epimerase-like protein (N-acyl-D-glucosamine 2-epimerase family)